MASKRLLAAAALPLLFLALVITFINIGFADARAITSNRQDIDAGRSVVDTPLDDYFHYAQVIEAPPSSLRRFVKRDLPNDEFEMDLPYRDFNLRLKLQPNEDLFAGRNLGDLHPTINPRHFLKGTVHNIPDSFVRLTIVGEEYDRVEGTIYLGSSDLGALHVDCASRYIHAHPNARMVVYHQLDVKNDRSPRAQALAYVAGGLQKRDGGETGSKVHISPSTSADVESLLNQLFEVLQNGSNGTVMITSSLAGGTGVMSVVDQRTGKKTDVKVVNPNAQSKKGGPKSGSGARSGSQSKNKNKNKNKPQAHAPTRKAAPKTKSPSTPPAPKPQAAKKPNGNICKVALLADKSFADAHRNEKGGVQAYMASILNDISGFYSSQLGVGLNLAFSFVDTNGKSGCGLPVSGDVNKVVPAVNRVAACIPGLNPKDKCVIQLLSSNTLGGAAAGVSFVGTVCQNGANAGISTDRQGKIPRRDLTTILMHEIGHTFGANHDTAGSKCDQGKYVMFPAVQSGSPNMFKFSPCSLRDIQKNLQNPQKRCMFGGAQKVVVEEIKAGNETATAPNVIVDYW
ncbi:hypothetical protein HK102_009805 [Quaeritorhiza haematococci]|nr:hypothetical protein HK102_009805 [Quaeritorhiza haematococci]